MNDFLVIFFRIMKFALCSLNVTKLVVCTIRRIYLKIILAVLFSFGFFVLVVCPIISLRVTSDPTSLYFVLFRCRHVPDSFNWLQVGALESDYHDLSFPLEVSVTVFVCSFFSSNDTLLKSQMTFVKFIFEVK